MHHAEAGWELAGRAQGSLSLTGLTSKLGRQVGQTPKVSLTNPSCSWNWGGSPFLRQSREPTPGRVRDQLDIFQNKIISATETGFSFPVFHMLKFLSPNSSAAAVQGTQLYRATGSTSAYLWQKADEKSCEPTNHNPSVIKQLENGAWHGAEETRAIQAAAGYCSNLAFPTARVTTSKFLMRWDFPQGSQPLSRALKPVAAQGFLFIGLI